MLRGGLLRRFDYNHFWTSPWGRVCHVQVSRDHKAKAGHAEGATFAFQDTGVFPDELREDDQTWKNGFKKRAGRIAQCFVAA